MKDYIELHIAGVQKGNCLADLVDTGSVLRCRLGR